MSDPQLSLQLYSLRSRIAEDLRGTLRDVADLGLRLVEPYGFVERVDDYRRALADCGLMAPSAHARLVGSVDVEATLAAASALGVHVLIEPAVPAERWQSQADVLATARSLNALVAPAARQGLRVGYHNHDWEFGAIGEASTYDMFVDALDPLVVLEVDTYWSSAAGVDTPQLLKRLGSRVGFLHIKDGPLTWDLHEQVPAGSGLLPLDAILDAAPDTVKVIEFDDYDGDVLTAVEESVSQLERRGVTL